MKLTLKSVKIHDDMSEETTCFSATLHVDGKRVAHVKNDGRGGCNFYHWESPKSAGRSASGPKPSPEDYDLWLDPEVQDPRLLGPLLKPCPGDDLEAHPVGRLVNDARNEDPKCVEPQG